MRDSQVIISVTTLRSGWFDSTTLLRKDTPGQVQRFILDRTEQERIYLNTALGVHPHEDGALRARLTEGDLKDVLTKCEGTLRYSLGPDELVFSFLADCGEYQVSDSEMARTLEAFCNTGRTSQDYARAAEAVTAGTHRAILAELWRFIKALVKAFARSEHDLRNRTAVSQAAETWDFMESRDY